MFKWAHPVFSWKMGTLMGFTIMVRRENLGAAATLLFSPLTTAASVENAAMASESLKRRQPSKVWFRDVDNWWCPTNCSNRHIVATYGTIGFQMRDTCINIVKYYGCSESLSLWTHVHGPHVLPPQGRCPNNAFGHRLATTIHKYHRWFPVSVSIMFHVPTLRRASPNDHSSRNI